jgi:hypothetical protein
VGIIQIPTSEIPQTKNVWEITSSVINLRKPIKKVIEMTDNNPRDYRAESLGDHSHDTMDDVMFVNIKLFQDMLDEIDRLRARIMELED